MKVEGPIRRSVISAHRVRSARTGAPPEQSTSCFYRQTVLEGLRKRRGFFRICGKPQWIRLAALPIDKPQIGKRVIWIC